MALITSDEFAAVRAAINVSLDDEALPDAIVALPIYLGAADSEVKVRDPLWNTRSVPDLRHLKNAVIYFTAARLVLAIPRLTSEAFGQRYLYKVDAIPLPDLIASLLAFGNQEIERVINPDSDELIEKPIMFTVGQVSRHRSRFHRSFLDL